MKLNIQIIGTPKCKNTNKAIRFFKERGLKIHFVDLRERPISKGELDNIKRIIPEEELIDCKGKEYEKRRLEYMLFDISEKLLETPLLLRTPIVRNGNKVTVGNEPDIWKKWITEAKNEQ
jgi:arsenate reductase-like glutaredoxin family protein